MLGPCELDWNSQFSVLSFTVWPLCVSVCLHIIQPECLPSWAHHTSLLASDRGEHCGNVVFGRLITRGYSELQVARHRCWTTTTQSSPERESVFSNCKRHTRHIPNTWDQKYFRFQSFSDLGNIGVDFANWMFMIKAWSRPEIIWSLYTECSISIRLWIFRLGVLTFCVHADL